MLDLGASPDSIRPGRFRFALPSRGAPGVLLLLLLVGCKSNSSNVDGGDQVAFGKQFVAQRNCAMCHDDGDGTLSGQTTPENGMMVFGTNLTPDHLTGLGDWADIEIVRSLKFGVDRNNQPLCPPMPHYADASQSPGMSDVEASAIVAYLRSLPPVSRPNIPPSMCPPIKPAPPVDLGVVPDLGASSDLAVSPTDGAASD